MLISLFLTTLRLFVRNFLNFCDNFVLKKICNLRKDFDIGQKHLLYCRRNFVFWTFKNWFSQILLHVSNLLLKNPFKRRKFRKNWPTKYFILRRQECNTEREINFFPAYIKSWICCKFCNTGGPQVCIFIFKIARNSKLISRDNPNLCTVTYRWSAEAPNYLFPTGGNIK
jgi:hypothetical protein